MDIREAEALVRSDQAKSYPEATEWPLSDLSERAWDIVHDHRSGYGEGDPLDEAYAAVAKLHGPLIPQEEW